jgi:hypothetical protein
VDLVVLVQKVFRVRPVTGDQMVSLVNQDRLVPQDQRVLLVILDLLDVLGIQDRGVMQGRSDQQVARE